MMYIFYEKLKIFFHNYGLQFLTQKSFQKNAACSRIAIAK